MKVPPPSDLRVTNYSSSDITVRWEAAADDVVSYLIKWISLSGGDLRQVEPRPRSFSRFRIGHADDHVTGITGNLNILLLEKTSAADGKCRNLCEALYEYAVCAFVCAF